MEIPKWIDKNLKDRAKYVEKVQTANIKLERWLELKEIYVEQTYIDGIDVLINPVLCDEKIRTAIFAKPIKKRIIDEKMYIRKLIAHLVYNFHAEIFPDDLTISLNYIYASPMMDIFKDYFNANNHLELDVISLPVNLDIIFGKVNVKFNDSICDTIGVSQEDLKQILKEFE